MYRDRSSYYKVLIVKRRKRRKDAERFDIPEGSNEFARAVFGTRLTLEHGSVSPPGQAAHPIPFSIPPSAASTSSLDPRIALSARR